MKYWQKKRNYRKYPNADGTFTCTVTVDGQEIEVSAEVYAAYSQGDRRERYQDERDEGMLLSLEKFAKNETRLSGLPDWCSESTEDTVVRNLMVEKARTLLPLLNADEKELINLLFFESIPLREVARRKGVYPQAIAYRRDRIVSKLKKLLDF